MKTIFFVVTVLIATVGYSQEYGSIKGNVLDTEMQNEPLIFAYVKLKETNQEKETNFHGSFEFTNLRIGKYTLVVSYPGYKSIETPIVVKEGTVSNIDLSLEHKKLKLGDVSDIVSSKEK